MGKMWIYSHLINTDIIEINFVVMDKTNAELSSDINKVITLDQVSLFFKATFTASTLQVTCNFL
jgi:hypothetical protein